MARTHREWLYSFPVFALTVITFIIAFLTPPLAGPLCTADCVKYPYTDVIGRFPRDYYWMISAILLEIAFVLFIADVHKRNSIARSPFTLAALCFATLSSGILIINYYVQLTVVQPSLLRGEFEGMALISQYNPHGLFIALEEVGYLLMSVTFGFLAAARLAQQRWLQRILIINPIVAFIGLAFFAIQYGNDREYRFEIFVISLEWLTLLALSLGYRPRQQ